MPGRPQAGVQTGVRRFRDRPEAGRILADRLAGRRLERPVVLALPRGGVPVGVEVAERLGAPFDVFVARKIGAPGQPELGIGAVAEGSDEVVLTDLARQLHLDPGSLPVLERREAEELRRRVQHYRGGRPPLPGSGVTGNDVILVDDGLATGVTAEAALLSLRRRRPRRLILAVPVGATETERRLVASGLVDEVVCEVSSDRMVAVGAWYDDFSQTTDDEVLEILDRAGFRGAPGRAPGGAPGRW
jgi:putative phosphoribosyl transferase